MMSASISERINSPFAARLSKLMEEKGYIQQQLADVIKAKRQTVAQYIDGTIFPRADKLMAIADHFNVSCDYLMGKDACAIPDNEEIRKKTGLSELAIERLKEYNEKQSNVGVSVGYIGVMRALNTLIASEQGLNCLRSLARFLYGDFSVAYAGDGEKIDRVLVSSLPPTTEAIQTTRETPYSTYMETMEISVNELRESMFLRLIDAMRKMGE